MIIQYVTITHKVTMNNMLQGVMSGLQHLEGYVDVVRDGGDHHRVVTDRERRLVYALQPRRTTRVELYLGLVEPRALVTEVLACV